ncbi:MAG: hypothetical protein ACTSRC_05070 [Candidatus Helarchaeota archaeon]
MLALPVASYFTNHNANNRVLPLGESQQSVEIFLQVGSADQDIIFQEVRAAGGVILKHYNLLQLMLVQIPKAGALSIEGVKILPNRQFAGALDQSVDIIKPAASWALLETQFGYTINGTGINISGGSFDILLVKFNATGHYEWNKTIGGTGVNSGRCVVVDKNDTVYLTGAIGPAGNSDVFLFKYNSAGVLLDSWFWGGVAEDNAAKVVLGINGSLYLAGYTKSFGAAMNDAFVAKFNSTGSLLWNETWGGSNNDQATGLAVNGDGNSYISCWSESFGSLGTIGCVKFNVTGGQVWNKTWDWANDDDGNGIALDNRSNIYIVGTVGMATNDALILKYGCDADNDGLTTDEELYLYGTNPTNPDSDEDGLDDYAEVITHGTNATNPDSDGDGFTDKEEIDAGTNPWDPNSYPSTGIPFTGFWLCIGVIAATTLLKILKPKQSSVFISYQSQ